MSKTVSGVSVKAVNREEKQKAVGRVRREGSPDRECGFLLRLHSSIQRTRSFEPEVCRDA